MIGRRACCNTLGILFAPLLHKSRLYWIVPHCLTIESNYERTGEIRNVAERTEITKTVIDCVECGERITLSGRVEMGQTVRCPECVATMEVVSLDPVEVDWIYGESAYADQEEEDR